MACEVVNLLLHGSGWSDVSDGSELARVFDSSSEELGHVTEATRSNYHEKRLHVRLCGMAAVGDVIDVDPRARLFAQLVRRCP